MRIQVNCKYFDHLNDKAHSTCNLLMNDGIGWKPSPFLVRRAFDGVINSCPLSSSTSPGSRIPNEFCSHIGRARLAFTNVGHLWRQRDIRLSFQRLVHAAAEKLVLSPWSRTITVEGRFTKTFGSNAVVFVDYGESIWWATQNSGVGCSVPVFSP